MKIDITDATSGEILDILTLYPQGRIKINNERVYWETQATIPRNISPSPGNNQGNPSPNNLQKANNFFNGMGNSLMSMMGAPQRREDGRR